MWLPRCCQDRPLVRSASFLKTAHPNTRSRYHRIKLKFGSSTLLSSTKKCDRCLRQGSSYKVSWRARHAKYTRFAAHGLLGAWSWARSIVSSISSASIESQSMPTMLWCLVWRRLRKTSKSLQRRKYLEDSSLRGISMARKNSYHQHQISLPLVAHLIRLRMQISNKTTILRGSRRFLLVTLICYTRRSMTWTKSVA